MINGNDVAHIIQLAVAPVFLLAGIGAFLNVMAHRLARIVDRSRELHSQQQLSVHEQQEIDILMRRATFTNVSISLCTFAATLNCLVVISLFVLHFTAHDAPALLASLFIATLLALVVGLLLLQAEIFLATKWLRMSNNS
ncbi:MAG: DUF2721 domain-containing protein [Pseudomonadales bacterium]|nr:DUF2721 domain-containing protein [Pseudomonadales bacterium]